MTANPLVTFVIVNYKCSNKVAAAVGSVMQHAGMPVQIVVVDNSNDAREFATLQRVLAPLPCEVIDAQSNRGFGAGCNLGAGQARGEHLFFLNPDAQLKPGALSTMLASLSASEQVGAVGCLVLNEGGRIESSHGEFINLRRPLKWCKHVLNAAFTSLNSNPVSEPQAAPLALLRADYVTGAALLMRTADFRALQGFDEAFFMYAEETDLQYRLLHQLGKHVVFDPSAQVFHEHGGTFTRKIERRVLLESGCLQFVRKHHGTAYAVTYKALTLLAICVEMACTPLHREYSLADNWRFLRHMVRA